MHYAHRLMSLLGGGQFGTVSKGMWQCDTRRREVAIKILNKLSNTVKFLQETAIMAQFRHPNVVKLHGVVIMGKQVSNAVLTLYT